MVKAATKPTIRLRLGPDLLEWPEEQVLDDPELQRQIQRLDMENETNPLQFFCPHGTAKTGVVITEPDGAKVDLSGDAKGWPLVSAVDWLNDDEHNMYVNKSPNRVGKTTIAIAKLILRIIKCNRKWTLFKQHGVKCPEWTGPKTAVILGYDKTALVDVLWPALQMWLPDYELGEFRAPARGGTQRPAWDRHPRLHLKQSGSYLIFATYNQDASVCTGFKADFTLPDEQMPEQFFTELVQRGRHKRQGMQFFFGYTPHQVPGRADTGANNFLARVWTGENTYAKKVLRTRITVPDAPDWVFPDEQKKEAYEELVVNPRKIADENLIREGMARYYGLDQSAAGLFYPEWSRKYHVIPWTYEDTKKLPGRYFRFGDHGFSAPTAWIWVWMSNMGEFVVYDEYRVTGVQAFDHARAVVEQSGNVLKEVKRAETTKEGSLRRYEEHIPHKGGQKFDRTELDWHCFSEEGGGLTIAQHYRLGGLRVSPSVTDKIESRSQSLRRLLAIDPRRKHLCPNKKSDVAVFGAPRFYVSERCRWLIWEIEKMQKAHRRVEGSHSPKETREDKDDHEIDTVEYMAARFAKAIARGRRNERIIKK